MSAGAAERLNTHFTDDVDAVVARVVELGGTVEDKPMMCTWLGWILLDPRSDRQAQRLPEAAAMDIVEKATGDASERFRMR
jgi:hypothetical protein